MKKIGYFVLMGAVSAMFAACGSPAGNSAANNANANAAKPVAAGPTTDTFLAMEKQANEAYIKGDSKFFEGLLSDKFVGVGGGQRTDKAAVVKMIAGLKCEIKDGWKLDELQMSMIDADTYAVSYKVTMEGTCTSDGHTEKMDKPIRSSTVWARSGEKWMPVFHGENVIVDPTAPPAKADAKKPEPRKEEAKKDDKAGSNANTASALVPAKSANTDALMAVERPLWEAWKDHDAKTIDALLSKDVSFVNIFGTYLANKADAIKDWTGAACDAKSVSLTDGVGISISPTVGILTLTGSADGKCGGKDISGQKIYGTSVYVKDGDTWKWAFGFNSPS